MEDKNYRRKNYFIDKGFQTTFIVRFCLLIVLASSLTCMLIYYLNRQTTTVAFEDLRVVVKSTSDFIFPIVLQILIIVTVFVGFASIAVALFTSHKIAGPLYRLKTELEKIREGDLSSPIKIRAADQLQKVVSDFDQMRSGFGLSLSRIKSNWDIAKAHLDALKKDAKRQGDAERIEESIKAIDSELKRFKTE